MSRRFGRPAPGAAVLGLLLCCVMLLTASAQEPASKVAAEVAPPRAFMLYTADGRTLHSREWRLWLGERTLEPEGANQAFVLEPVGAGRADVADGDRVLLRSREGAYVARLGFTHYLAPHRRLAATFRVARQAGPGTLQPGEPFDLLTPSGRFKPTLRWGALQLRPRARGAAWSLGCYFEPGPERQSWRDEVAFEVQTQARASEVARAVDWLAEHAVPVRLPSGDLPMVVWQDPTLEPEPTVAYLVTDTLWASRAVRPYHPDLSAAMQAALLSSGWYGNGLADALFHAVGDPAHGAASVDWVHGTLLDRCAVVGSDLVTVQIRVPEMTVDPALTAGNSALFSDSAVYTALAEYWRGDSELARTRLRAVIQDTRTEQTDSMFWDQERRVLVDQSSRCDYDRYVGVCSQACSSCVPCEGNACQFYNASYKLGLLLYGARVMGLSNDVDLAAPLAQMDARMWEGQLDDGGLPHLAFIGPDAEPLPPSGATGEATALAVLALTVRVAARP